MAEQHYLKNARVAKHANGVEGLGSPQASPLFNFKADAPIRPFGLLGKLVKDRLTSGNAPRAVLSNSICFGRDNHREPCERRLHRCRQPVHLRGI